MKKWNSLLTDQLQTRKVVRNALRHLADVKLGLNEEQAYLALQRQSRPEAEVHEGNFPRPSFYAEVRENSRAVSHLLRKWLTTNCLTRFTRQSFPANQQKYRERT